MLRRLHRWLNRRAIERIADSWSPSQQIARKDLVFYFDCLAIELATHPGGLTKNRDRLLGACLAAAKTLEEAGDD